VTWRVQLKRARCRENGFIEGKNGFNYASWRRRDMKLGQCELETERIEAISDEMRAIVESEWPELVYKLPPKTEH
jgi:hypothetical protein